MFKINDIFKLKENNTTVKTEILAGITTFLAMSYILAVNPNILGDAGMPVMGVFLTTAIGSGIACIIMGLVSNYPLALAPGLGLNSLFTYTVCITMGVPWQSALSALMITSILFLIITVSGLRNMILNMIPNELKVGIGAGIGFYIAFIGLKNAGIVVLNSDTIISLGNIATPSVLLATIGIFITLYLFIKKINVPVFLGMIITAILGIAMGFCGFGGMPSISLNFAASLDLSTVFAFSSGFGYYANHIPQLLAIIFSFLIVSFFDTTGTLIALGKELGLSDSDGNIRGIEKAFLGDALGGIVGSILGLSTVTAYLESSTGIENGGKTGLAAIVSGLCFFISIILSPLVIGLFTSSVTTPAMVMVGILMMRQVAEIDFNNIIEVAPVFMTIIMVITTSSITLGIMFGFITSFVCYLASKNYKKLSLSFVILTLLFVLYLAFGVT